MTVDLDRLRVYYDTLSDDELRSRYESGAQGFATVEVWSIVDAAFKNRFGSEVSPSDASVPPSVAVPSDTALSPWFVFERVAKRRWRSTDRLPTRYLTLMAVMAGLYTAVNAMALLAGLSDFFGYHLYPDEARAPWLELLNAAWSALFFVAASVRRPWAWFYLVWASLAGTLFDPLAAVAAVVWYPLLWLYLARRRSLFGLTPWPFVM